MNVGIVRTWILLALVASMGGLVGCDSSSGGFAPQLRARGDYDAASATLTATNIRADVR